MIKNKVVKIIISMAFIVCALILSGCGETTANNVFKITITNMNKISNTFDNVQDIDISELIIDDFMNENDLKKIDTLNYQDIVTTNNAMNTYVIKISSLNNNVVDTIEVNNIINNVKRQIYAKTSQIKSLCNQSLDAKVDLKNNQIKSLSELNNMIMVNNTRISLTRNEIINNLKNVKNIKKEYSSKPDQLNSRYTKLKTSLNTRLSYLNNMNSILEDMTILLSETSEFVLDSAPYKELYDDEKPIKAGLTKNIDTYENAGTNIYGDYRNNPIYNPDNYLKNYNPGYGMGGFGHNYGFGMGNYGMNGFGMNGMYPNGFGMNGYGTYGYNMPYGNGYLYPNINTFGTYKNIDTYRSKKDLNKMQEKDNKKDTDIMADRDLGRPTPQPAPIPYNDFEKEKYISNTPEINNENDEDKFVDNQNEPKVEKIQEKLN